MRTMKIEVKKREWDVAEPPILKLEVVEEETGAWVLSAAYYFTDDYTEAIKVFSDSDGWMAIKVPFHAWKNVYDNLIEILTEELDEKRIAIKELGRCVELVFQFEANDESLYRMAEKIAETIQQKYPDLFQ
ncbi:MAG: hypothetical protein QXT79_02445 [Thermofilaceae archaeon]